MGLNINSLRFLLGLREQGILFGRVLMIGRQSLAVTPGDVRTLLKRQWSEPSQSTLQRLTTGSDVYAEQFFELCGATRVDSMDKTAYEGATVAHDLNLPIPQTLAGAYDLIVDGGSIEHIFNIPMALRNYMAMLSIGGHYVCNTATNNYSGHGFYQLSPEFFYAAFGPENGFSLLDAYLYEENGRNRWYRLKPPADAARRMTFQNCVPAHLLILARKSADTEVFAQVPQQRMYHAAWTDGVVPGRSTDAGVRRALFERLRRMPARIMWPILNGGYVVNRFRGDLFTRED